MSIISARDNENDRWKRYAKNKQSSKHKTQQRVTDAIVKGWELNYFVEHLS